MTTDDAARDDLARHLDPDSWRLHDDPRYAHLPQTAQDAVVARSREQADLALEWFRASPIVTADRMIEAWSVATAAGMNGSLPRRFLAELGIEVTS